MISKTTETIYLCIENFWFDVSEYASRHPGGADILRKFHLCDATDEFNDIRGHADAYHLLESMEIKDPDVLRTIEQERNKLLRKRTGQD